MTHQNPSKTGIFMSKTMFLRGFGVPYVYKSIFLGETMFLMQKVNFLDRGFYNNLNNRRKKNPHPLPINTQILSQKFCAFWVHIKSKKFFPETNGIMLRIHGKIITIVFELVSGQFLEIGDSFSFKNAPKRQFWAILGHPPNSPN